MTYENINYSYTDENGPSTRQSLPTTQAPSRSGEYQSLRNHKEHRFENYIPVLKTKNKQNIFTYQRKDSSITTS